MSALLGKRRACHFSRFCDRAAVVYTHTKKKNKIVYVRVCHLPCFVLASADFFYRPFFFFFFSLSREVPQKEREKEK